MKTEHEILEKIQEALVNAGGKFFKQSELKNMKFGEIIHTIISNKIDLELTIKHDPRSEDGKKDGQCVTCHYFGRDSDDTPCVDCKYGDYSAGVVDEYKHEPIEIHILRERIKNQNK